MKKEAVFSLFLFLLIASVLHAQQSVADSSSREPVYIIHATNFYFKKIDATTELKILSGKVELKQGTVLFFCDSCVVNSTGHVFEAFGSVHINDHDTTNIYSDNLRYLTNTRIAYFNGNVRMTDGRATLTTPDLTYDVNTKIGTYTNGGKVVNKKSVLTSRAGTYYSDLRDIAFKTNVELKDPAYYLKTDSLLYNTETQLAHFTSETYIKDSSGRVMRTREGYYDMAHRHSEFYTRSTVEDRSMFASADSMASDDSTKIIQMRGRAVMKDTAKGMNVLANEIFINQKTDAFLATKKPLMIVRQDNDSIYVAADTLFSARLTDLYQKDTAKLKSFRLKEKDSTNRYFEAYRNVRVFSDSVQSVGDSLYYSFQDSTFRLFHDPVAWSQKSQITGDTIYLYTKNKKASRIQAFENSFMVNEVQGGVYNQIKSSRMDGYFKNGSLDSVRAKGLAESIYFIQDEDSSYRGTNQTKSDAIDIYFDKGDLYKVIFRSDLKGTLYPITQKGPGEMRLSNFKWVINRRPKTKYELFE
jgi:lipopolysaccharide export system protein LptA